MKHRKKAPKFLCKNESKMRPQNYIRNQVPKRYAPPALFARSKSGNYAKESSLYGAILPNSRCSK